MKKTIFFSIVLFGVMACQKSEPKREQSNIESSTADARQKTSTPSSQLLKADMEKSAKDADEKRTDKTEPNAHSQKSVSVQSSQKIALSKRKIIRNAQVKFKTAHIENTTYEVEKKAKMMGGFVVESNLTNTVINQQDMAVSNDSVMQVAQYQLINNMIVRVPSLYLDTFLSEISRQFQLLDYRHVTAEDVTLQYVEADLKARIRDETARRIQQASDKNGGRIDNISEAESTAADMQEAAVAHHISNAEKDFNIQYSLVKLDIYQDKNIVKTMMANPSLAAYKPSWGVRFLEAFSSGWTTVLDIFFGLLSIWYLFVLAGIALFFHKKYNLRAILGRKTLVEA